MSAIVTVTFSPCIDKSTTVNRLTPDIKLRCTAPKLEPGGGGINVARAIKKLGGEAVAVYPAGGYTGQFFTALLHKEKIPTVVIETSHATRENIIVLEEAGNRQYRLGMPGTLLMPNEWPKILGKLEEMKDAAYIVASGSLPPGVPEDIFARIAAIARQNNAKLLADTSGKALQQVIAEGIFLIKPNLGELGLLLGREFLAPAEAPAAARQLLRQSSCEVIVVSMGAAGALLVTKDLAVKIVPPPVERKSTVGAGDSMVAGIVFTLQKGGDIETAVKYGVACGTAATLNPGTELCNKADTQRIYNLLHTITVDT
jgi:6-phosphofructokinase 2